MIRKGKMRRGEVEQKNKEQGIPNNEVFTFDILHSLFGVRYSLTFINIKASPFNP
jgi:hypothetical protein